MPFANINLWAVLVCGVLSMVIGFLWYSNFLFGKAWSSYTGWTEEKIAQLPGPSMGVTYGGAFLLALVLALGLANVILIAGVTTLAGGLLAGALVWAGFTGATQGVQFLFERRPLGWFALASGYHLVELLVFGAILTLWK